MTRIHIEIENDDLVVREGGPSVSPIPIPPDSLKTEETLHSSMQLLGADDHTQYILHDDVPEATGRVERTGDVSGSETYRAIKDNETTSDPGSTDDSSKGYTVGSRWTNTATPKLFVCLDASVGAAVWKGH